MARGVFLYGKSRIEAVRHKPLSGLAQSESYPLNAQIFACWVFPCDLTEQGVERGDFPYCPLADPP